MEMCDICGCGSPRQAGTDPSFLLLSDHFFHSARLTTADNENNHSGEFIMDISLMELAQCYCFFWGEGGRGLRHIYI